MAIVGKINTGRYIRRLRNLTMAAALMIAGTVVHNTRAEPDLSLWETGGMYFCIPYGRGTAEIDLNYWYEDNTPGYSLYGSYAFSDKLTLKAEAPFDFWSAPFFQSMKVTGLYGILTKKGDFTLSGDANFDFGFGEEGRVVIGTIGGNLGKRWGSFALLTRTDGGVSMVPGSGGKSPNGVGEVEAAPFMYTGNLGIVGLPLMFEYGDRAASVNVAFDWELFLPKGFSFWLVPRYEVIGSSGFSVWTGVAWMRFPG
jgi:hypothetical protein